MDAFGTVVNAIHLAHRIIEYIQAVKDADEDCLKLTSEVSSIETLLLMLRDRIAEARQDPTNTWLSAIVALGIPGGPLDQCKFALEKIASVLVPSEGVRKLGRKLIWPFKRGDLSEYMATIERLKTLISLVFQASLSFVPFSSACHQS